MDVHIIGLPRTEANEQCMKESMNAHNGQNSDVHMTHIVDVGKEQKYLVQQWNADVCRCIVVSQLPNELSRVAGVRKPFGAAQESQ